MPNDGREALRLEVREGLALVTFDQPDRGVNLIHRNFFDDFEEIVEAIESSPTIEAAIVRSGKPNNFVAGADLDLVRSFRSSDEARDFARRGQTLLDRIADSPKRWVAAIHGAAMGGGLELALACHTRLATDDPVTVLSLPEVKVGLLPAGGGTQRLPRLVGLSEGLGMMLTGSRVRVSRARSIGLVDEICNPQDLEERSIELARSGVDHAPSISRLITRLPLVRHMILGRAKRRAMDRTRGRYPAPLAILKCVATGFAEGYEDGLELEARSFGRLAMGRESRNLIWLFHTTGELKKRPTPHARAVEKVGVLGAGLMGSGIAAVTLPVAEVVLEDISEDALEKAKKSIGSDLERRTRSGAMSPEDAEMQKARLTTARSPRELAACNIVIEAVIEDPGVKNEILREVAEAGGPATILASNTSAIPIRTIAEGIPGGDRVLGMHYFSPVPRMPLLEIVRTEATSESAVDTAVRLGIDQGKIPIVVADGPGFYTTRVLAPLLNESVILVEEGVPVTEIDDAMRSAGFALGPITLLDEVGLDVAAHVSETLGKAFASRGHRPSASLDRLVQHGLLGHKSGEGFYIWRPQPFRRGRRVSRRALEIVSPAKSRSAGSSEIVDRCLLVMVNEAVHCHQDGVVDRPATGDAGAILGIGFPPFRGGPFHYVDTFGPKAIVSKLEDLAARHGARFSPAPELVEMAKAKRHYYE